MKRETLRLRIADLLFSLEMPRAWAPLVRHYWKDYLADAGQPTIQGRIWAVEDRGDIRVDVDTKNNKFQIFAQNPGQFLRRFSECLRAAINPFLFKYQGFILHASSVVFENQGYIFSGPSGAGKSTIRKMLKLPSLGDDSAIIRKIGKRFYLFGSPFYERTKTIYPNQKLAIGGIYFLKQARENKLRQLIPEEAFPAILANIRLVSFANSGHVSDNFKKAVETVASLTRQDWFFELYFTKDKSPWLLIKAVSKLPQLLDPRFWQSLPPMVWGQKEINRQELADLRISKSVSLYFEFSGRRKIKVVAEMIRKGNLDGPHTREVKDMLRAKFFPNDFWAAVKERGGWTLIDGNHRALAAFLAGRRKLPPLIYGQLLRKR